MQTCRSGCAFDVFAGFWFHATCKSSCRMPHTGSRKLNSISFSLRLRIISCQLFYAKLALSSIRWINIRRDSSRLEFYVIRITEAIIGENIEYCFSDFHVCSSVPSPFTMVFLSREYMHLQSAARVGGTAKDPTPITRTENRHQKSRK